MADKAHYEMNAEPGRYEIKGSPVGLTATRTAETWQFFAFVFAATVTFFVAIIEELPPFEMSWMGLGEVWLLRLGLKVLAFLIVGYATLFSPRRNWLVRLLMRVKTEEG